MNTPTPGQPHLTLADTPTGDTTDASRQRQAGVRLPAFVRDNWPLAVFALATLSVLGGLLWLIWVILAALARALGSGASAASDSLSRLGGWLAGGPITHAISDPVRAFLDAHTAGLPATGGDLWITWLVTAGVLYAMGLAGSRYARIGWAGIGALTAAAAYFGAPAGTGPAAAGVTAAVWLLLSLPVYARARRTSVLEQIALDLAARRAVRERATIGKA